jgi:hypothetical protein
MTRWDELPAHIKITYQSQAQYELQQGILCEDDTGLHHAAPAVCCLMFLGEVDLETPDAI